MNPNFEPYVRGRDICLALGGICRRTLYERVRRGEFPAPDRPAQKRGECDLWLESTVTLGLKRYGEGSPAKREAV
jgi:hypothetical protein